MDIDFLYRFLKEHKQEHVITILDHMPLEKKRGLFKQIQEIASRSY